MLDRRNFGIHRNQDIQRAMDYLESRQDIDPAKIAYFGLSWGAGNGVIDAVVDERFRAVILHDGGFFLGAANPPPELNQVNFAPRMRIPVLMINGRYDFFFPLEESQKPLFRMLGSPPAQKRHAIFEAAHDVSMLRQPVMREVLDWLDKYLGPTQR
jgi:dienelactone hydrolase